MLDLHEGTASVFADAQSIAPDSLIEGLKTGAWWVREDFVEQRRNEERKNFTCPVCQTKFTENWLGRPRKYCSRICALKVSWQRHRRRTIAQNGQLELKFQGKAA